MKKLLCIMLALLIAAALTGCGDRGSETTDFEDTYVDALPENAADGLTLHAFNWTYREIETNLEAIRDAGFKNVLTMPVQQPKGGGSAWWAFYQPLSFSIGDSSALGTKEELASLRFHPDRVQSHRVFIQTFGNFEFFVDGKPIEFKYSKTKEILAVLVNNRGAYTTNGEIIACLWEDDGDPEKKASYLSNLRQDLQNTFTRLKLNGIILKQRGSLAVAMERIECDLYEWMEKKKESRYQYLGDYMNQYSWPEVMHAELDELSWAIEDD